MIYKLGVRFKFVRVLYRKITGKGLWGLMGEIQDYKPKKDEPKYETKDYNGYKYVPIHRDMKSTTIINWLPLFFAILNLITILIILDIL
jgi:hypothetical protein